MNFPQYELVLALLLRYHLVHLTAPLCFLFVHELGEFGEVLVLGLGLDLLGWFRF